MDLLYEIVQDYFSEILDEMASQYGAEKVLEDILNKGSHTEFLELFLEHYNLEDILGCIQIEDILEILMQDPVNIGYIKDMLKAKGC